MSLYQKVRPASFDEVVGNVETVASLRALTAKENPPHAYLLSGPSGCGKTSLGRIIARALGVRAEDVTPFGTGDYRELDNAHFRGIETIREIRDGAGYVGMHGTRRVWLLDECFARATRVMTPIGEIPIQDIRPGDCVYSLAGPSRVLRAFHNIVSIDRIIRLELSNGRTIFTTIDHLFRLLRGWWRRAGSLCVGDLLLSFSFDIVRGTDREKWIRDGVEDLSGVPRSVFSQEKQPMLLLSELWQEIKRSGQNSRSIDAFLSSVWERDAVLSGPQEQSRDVWESLCYCLDSTEEHGTRGLREYEVQDYCGDYAISGYPIGAATSSVKLRAHDEEQPVSRAGSDREGQGDEAYSRFSKRLEGEAWWEWETDDSSGNARHDIGMADGGRRFDGAFSQGRQRVSDLLQGRYRECSSETWDRGRRQGSPKRDQSGEGCEEGAEIGGVRVESVEVYQPGRRNENFRSVIDDQERDCGFATFYDLEVENDPSYFVEGVAVHNCHGLPKLSQDALLKGLEDPPSHAFFVLCTTQPENLLETIRSRCSRHKVSSLSEADTVRLLHRIASIEGERLPRPLYGAIFERTDGKPREAINLLEKILAADPDARGAIVAEHEAVREKSDGLARALLGRRGWKAVVAVLKDVNEDDVESVRRGVISYMSKILLSGENDEAMAILDQMIEPFFVSGKAGLIHAAYLVCRGV